MTRRLKMSPMCTFPIKCGAQSGCNYVKKLNFSKEIKKKHCLVSKIRTIGGKSVRVYEKE